MTDILVSASGMKVSASPSDRIVVRLPENGSTGYQWVITEIGEPLEVESNEFARHGQFAPGAAGERVVILRLRGPGRARVSLQLKRSWEPEPIDLFEFEVDAPDD